VVDKGTRQDALDETMTTPIISTLIHNKKHNKFINPYFRWRAQLMDDLTRQDWNYEELGERFCLDTDTVKNILFEWRKRSDDQTG
jgi:hypothetical protein